jgi:hypothetical protein
MMALLVGRVPTLRQSGRPVALFAIAALLAGCEGGSGQSGSAFTFLSVDGFSLTQGEIISSITSSTSQVTSTTACVTLRNNLKNPTVTAPTTLDNIIVRSYTLTLNGRAFTFGTAVLVPAGTVTMGNPAGNTATLGVVVAPAGAKGGAGSTAIAEFTFSGRDGRGQSVHGDGAVTVLFSGGDEPTTTCTGTTPSPTPTPTPSPTPTPTPTPTPQ